MPQKDRSTIHLDLDEAGTFDPESRSELSVSSSFGYPENQRIMYAFDRFHLETLTEKISIFCSCQAHLLCFDQSWWCPKFLGDAWSQAWICCSGIVQLPMVHIESPSIPRICREARPWLNHDQVGESVPYATKPHRRRSLSSFRESDARYQAKDFSPRAGIFQLYSEFRNGK